MKWEKYWAAERFQELHEKDVQIGATHGTVFRPPRARAGVLLVHGFSGNRYGLAVLAASRRNGAALPEHRSPQPFP